MGVPQSGTNPMGHACDVWGDDEKTAANSQVANFILGLFENGFFEVSELICCMELRALRAWGRMKWLARSVGFMEEAMGYHGVSWALPRN